MKAKAFAAIAAATAVVALCAPAGAMARGSTAGANQNNPTVVATMSLYGSNGYLVGVNLINRSALKITTFPEDGSASVETDYELEAPQPPGSDQIKASLGKFGRIDVRFIPKSTSEVEALLPRCKGEMDQVEDGEFVGLIAFRGEGGYTRVRRKRAFGSIAIAPAPACRQTTLGRKPHVRLPHRRSLAALLATAQRAAKQGAHVVALKATAAHPAVTFEALRNSGPNRKGNDIAFDTFAATASRDFGRIHMEGFAAELFARGPYFKVPDLQRPTSEVMLNLPRPFLGSATFRHQRGDNVSWDGDLRVNLPGFGVVPLTGPAFKAVMCADAGCHLTG